jgi:NADH:ubiquinone oxidoreductase subunit 3 (subunit A)
MKHKEITGFLVIAIILVLFALFFFLYSQFIGKMTSFRIHNELQEVHDSNNSGKSLTLSNEKVMELIEFASQDEERWRRTTGSSIKILFYTAILLFLLASIQIAIYLCIYKRDIALAPKPGGAN